MFICLSVCLTVCSFVCLSHSVYLSVCLSHCVFICLSVSLFIILSHCLSVCLSVQDGGLSLEPNYVEQFSELNLVLDGLRRRDIQPALE